MPKKSKLVRVEWHDAEGKTGWQGKEDIADWIGRPITLAETVGFLVRDDEHCVIVAQSDSLDMWSDLTKIPRAMIVKVEQLRSVRGRANEEKPKPP